MIGETAVCARMWLMNDCVSEVEDSYAQSLKLADTARKALRNCLVGRWVTFSMLVDRWPKDKWEIQKGLVHQVYIERRRIKIELWTWDKEGKKRTYTHSANPQHIKSISDTEPTL